MSSDLDIICKNLVIEFPSFDRVSRSLHSRLSGDGTKVKTFIALDGIDMTVGKGDRVALLGKNGAGKSTLLRTIAGIYAPASGSIELSSEPKSLFGIGVGMDENATGYENIPLLMATRKIPQSEIDEVTSDVEDFTELGEALNRPIRTYSTGMRLRIAFAIATFSRSEILLMDEAIGVGDRDFRQKSQKRLQDMMHKAGTMVFASHSNPLLKQHCNRGIVLDKGKVAFDGDIDGAIDFHEGS